MTSKELLKDMILPDNIICSKNAYTNEYGKFHFYPFDKGVGVTIANSFRRVLLSAVSGYAITSVQISGVKHEFDVIPGVKEDVLDIVLALKKVHLALVDGIDQKVIHIEKKGAGNFVAGDLEVDPTVKVVNKDLLLATLDDEADFSIDLQIQMGKGYRSSEEFLKEDTSAFVIAIDAIFSPVVKVNFDIEDYRVGDKTNCEKINLEVWTDGTIDPISAVSQASFILKKYFSLFMDIQEEEEEPVIELEEKEEENHVLYKTIEELDLSVRSYNCLKSAGINTIKELIEYDVPSLMKLKNFGKKSLDEISDKLVMYGLSFKDND